MRRGTSKPEKFDLPGSWDGELQWRMIFFVFWYSFMTFQCKGCRLKSEPSIFTAQIPAGLFHHRRLARRCAAGWRATENTRSGLQGAFRAVLYSNLLM
jgi:hypothetical protein